MILALESEKKIMSKYNISDYEVRVWDGMVTIFLRDKLMYSSARGIGNGLQTNTNDVGINMRIKSICNYIANQFVDLENLLNTVED